MRRCRKRTRRLSEISKLIVGVEEYECEAGSFNGYDTSIVRSIARDLDDVEFSFETAVDLELVAESLERSRLSAA